MFREIVSGATYRCLIDGQWRDGRVHPPIDVTSPCDGRVIGKIQALSKEEVDEAFAAAKAAQKKWAQTPVNHRAVLLHKAADLLEEHCDEIARILSEEIAKDIDSAVSEVQRTADFIRFTADEGKHMEGETVGADHFPGFKKQRFSVVTRVPLGVVLAIAPFNYPVNLSVSKIAPALMAGNSVILKPPTAGALSALYLAEVFRAAGLPAGVLNTVTGRGSEIGDYLVTHPDVDFISFTGSTAVGRRIASQAQMVPLLLELGGKDAAIILEDADLQDAAKNIVAGAYSYSGQRCTAVKRVLVMESVADELAALLKAHVDKLKVGLPSQPVQITPLINKQAADFVQELIDDAVEKGAQLLCGGRREGNLIYPTLFDRVTTDMRLAWEEPFGPVLPILRVQSVDEAIRIANDSEYGLQSAVFTKNIDRAFYVANNLEVGTVHINNKTERGPDHFPFLGVKASGMGTQGIRYSIEAMSRPKVVIINLGDERHE
ncbi:MAG: NADP-dependent glyceraldehyde-3-phosphate dehydrogenase [Eubacteriales bacterium]|nr:NADP-dependent glyceraldehyde-3-phosphate dehydrogenase [Eubacteriales bacterium]